MMLGFGAAATICPTAKKSVRSAKYRFMESVLISARNPNYFGSAAFFAGAVLAFGARGMGSTDAGVNIVRSGKVVFTPSFGTLILALQTTPLRMKRRSSSNFQLR